ncbi:hypothetical protein KA005_85315, partial [bacterium]|nr:hypothetical protein [bacterium]
EKKSERKGRSRLETKSEKCKGKIRLILPRNQAKEASRARTSNKILLTTDLCCFTLSADRAYRRIAP